MEDIQVTIQRGDMMEFERTGIYPEYLKFYSKEHKRTWRFKLVNSTQNGNLKVKGIKIFEYEFSNNDCRLRKIKNDEPVTPWYEIEEVMFEMRD